MLRLLATASVAALLAAAPAFAQSSGSMNSRAGSPASTSNSSKSDLSKADKEFVRHAAQGGMAEVELGKMAQQKAQSPEVKEFGERMVQDHGAANEKLKSVASSMGVDMPKNVGKEHKEAEDKLQKLSGAQFDREYMRTMVKDHQKDVKEFDKEAKSGKDAEVKSFAQETLPTLKDHLQMAQSIEKGMRAQAPVASKRSNSGTAGSSTPSTQR
jgi:putative membrane protein